MRIRGVACLILVRSAQSESGCTNIVLNDVRRGGAPCAAACDPACATMRAMNAPHMRIGEGWDTHALVQGRPLILGGITIPHSHGLLGHSDADALLHAITDALLGAAALGDIGQHFPDTDPTFKGADSVVLLQEAARRVAAAGWAVGNIDTTIVAFHSPASG